MCVGSVCFVCKFACVVDGAVILVSIVVSIPACHAGDPGSIPGREAFALVFIFALCTLLLVLARSSLRFVVCCLLCCFVALSSFALFIFALHSVLYILRRCS